MAFNSPVLIKDYRQFFSLANMFKAVIMVVYVDPNDPNKERILEAMVEARKRIPLDLKPDTDGSYDINKKQDVLFVLSTTPNLMFFQFQEGQSQALLMPFGDVFNAFETHL
jgi:hypothetical protein